MFKIAEVAVKEFGLFPHIIVNRKYGIIVDVIEDCRNTEQVQKFIAYLLTEGFALNGYDEEDDEWNFTTEGMTVRIANCL